MNISLLYFLIIMMRIGSPEFTTTLIDTGYAYPYHCSFSPDGKKLAYLRFDVIKVQLVIYDIESQSKKILLSKEYSNKYTSSPLAGRTPDLMDVKWLDEEEIIASLDGIFIEIIDAKTGKVIREYELGDTTEAAFIGLHTFKFSPQKDKTALAWGGYFYCSMGICVFPLKPPKEPYRLFKKWVGIIDFDWSPDGEKIAFTTSSEAERDWLSAGVYTVNYKTCEIETLWIDKGRGIASPFGRILWQPEGFILVDCSPSGEKYKIIRLDGREKKKVTINEWGWSAIGIVSENKKEIKEIKYLPTLLSLYGWDFKRDSIIGDIDDSLAQWLSVNSIDLFNTTVLDTWNSDSTYTTASIMLDKENIHGFYPCGNLLLIEFKVEQKSR